MLKKCISWSVLLFWMVLISCTDNGSDGYNYTNQKNIAKFIEEAVYHFENHNEYSKIRSEFPNMQLKGNLDAVQIFYEKAWQIDNKRIDIAHGLSSVYVLSGKIKQAIELWTKILAIDSKNFDAALKIFVYSRVWEQNVQQNSLKEKLKKIDDKKFQSYEEALERLDTVNKRIWETDYTKKYEDKNHVIVVLASASHQGVPSEDMKKRLLVAKDLAKIYLESSLILSGGGLSRSDTGGFTESLVMKNWLIRNNIAPQRLILDPRSEDTVWNAIYVLNILDTMKTIRYGTIVTNGNEARRVLNIFVELSRERNLNIEWDLAPTYPTSPYEEQSEFDKIAIYRDFLRAKGLSLFPGIKR